MLRIQATNYRGLPSIDWRVEPGLRVLVGPNGAGKSSLLSLPLLWSALVTRATAPIEAIDALGGVRTLRYAGSESAIVSLEASNESCSWEMKYTTTRNGVLPYPQEEIRQDGAVLIARESGKQNVQWGEREIYLESDNVGRFLSSTEKPGGPFQVLLQQLRGYRLFKDYNLPLLQLGSKDNNSTRLHQDGENVFSVLRNWSDKREDRKRRDFVCESLRDCFGFFEDFEFERGGGYVNGLFLHKKYQTMRLAASSMPSGFLTALLHLCAVAGTNPGEAISIDDFENHLHPRALHLLLTIIDDYATRHGVGITLATQSPLVLDFFDGKPEQVFVVDARYSPAPKCLTDLVDVDYLSHFRLGEKFAEGAFGSEKELT